MAMNPHKPEPVGMGWPVPTRLYPNLVDRIRERLKVEMPDHIWSVWCLKTMYLNTATLAVECEDLRYGRSVGLPLGLQQEFDNNPYWVLTIAQAFIINMERGMSKQELHARIGRDVQYYPPDAKAVEAHNRIRTATANLAHVYVEVCPEGRELSMALTKLIDEAMAHANAAVARNHDKL